MERILALDLGNKRVGIAVSDPLKMFAQGIDILNIRGSSDLLSKLNKFFVKYSIEIVLIGNPLDKNGQESKTTEYVKKIANLIEKHFKVKTLLWDERYTTKEAIASLKEFNAKKKHLKHIDKVAAQIILQSYLETKRNEKLNQYL